MYESHADIKPFPFRSLIFLGAIGWGMTWYAPNMIPAGSQRGIDTLLDIVFGASGHEPAFVFRQLTTTMGSGHWLEVLGYGSMGFAVLVLVMWMLGASQAAAKAQPKRPKHKKLINEG